LRTTHPSIEVQAMKLLFPNGEHEPVELRDGETLVGAGSDCHVMLASPGIATRHGVLTAQGEQVLVRSQDAHAIIVLNGKQLAGETAIKPGDLLLFGRVGCRVVATEKAPTAPLPRRAPAASEEDGRTRVRMALPKFVMRGVSGPTFGKTFGVVGALTLGRSTECDVSIPSDEISRHHAKLQVVPDGVMVEDMGSANGTFVNNQRVHGGTLMKPGDELRLDTVRFMLMSPGMEAHSTPVPRAEPATVAPARKSAGNGLWIAAALIAAAVIALGILRHLGKI
jgi:pSer/pThr/pTyr-binding forkhead associated (FHA) protein